MTLIGWVNGVWISFKETASNLYVATIPKNLNGRYIIALKAIDDAGNISNFVKTYVYIDFNHMVFKLVDDPFEYGVNKQIQDFIQIEDDQTFLENDSVHIDIEFHDIYSYKELTT